MLTFPDLKKGGSSKRSEFSMAAASGGVQLCCSFSDKLTHELNRKSVRTDTTIVASIPAPLLKRGPGNHCLRVGGFNSKFVSKTLCILSINLLYYGHPRG